MSDPKPADPPLSRRYQLVVQSGEVDRLVRESTRMPLLQPPPAVVTWGSRTFVLASAEDADPLVYREAMVWAADSESVAE